VKPYNGASQLSQKDYFIGRGEIGISSLTPENIPQPRREILF